MDTKKLRQKILDLAIHGKLVPQDPNDEPASVLLERIKAEKEQLIKEGKIKRQKKSASSDTSHYGNMPKGWANTTIGEIFTLQAGKNISSQEIHPNRSPNFQYPCYGGNGIRGYVSTANRNGDYPIIGRQGALCGNVNIASDFFYATEHAVVVQLYCNMNLKWAFYVLTALNLNQYATATAQPGLAVNVINDVPLLLPPIQEQERISREIDNYFSLLESFEKNIICLNSNVHQAKSLVLDLALSGKLTTSHTSHYPQLPDGWKEVRLGDICRLISGTSYSKNDVKPDGIRILRGGNIQYGKVLLLDNDVYISTSLRNKECSLMKGDIIIVASTGSFDLIGKAGYIEQDIPNAQIGAFLRIVRPIDSSISQYLRLIFESILYRSHIQDLAKGTNINNIKASYITDFCIPLPPMGERKKICNIVKIIFQQLDDIESSMLK